MPVPRVLVVDDESAVREVLSEFLQDIGYEVRTADTAIGALTEVRAWQPDVVLLDLNMPGAVRGEAVVAALSADTPVVIITGEINLEIARGTLRDGAFDFVSKPFDLRRVRDIVEAAVVYRRGE